jgi:hypothetical protein
MRRPALAIGVPFAGLGLAQVAGWAIAARVGLAADELDVTARLPVLMVAALCLYLLTLKTAWHEVETRTSSLVA